MVKRETPRDEKGQPLCEFCLEEPVPASLGTKPRRYCCRSHRQRAYEMRKQGVVIRHAVATAVDLVRGTSRDDAGGTSRDVPKQPVRRPEPVETEPLFQMPADGGGAGPRTP